MIFLKNKMVERHIGSIINCVHQMLDIEIKAYLFTLPN